MRSRILIILLAFIASLSAGAQIPFEKKGKWGMKDTTNNKVIVKPQYLSIEEVPGHDLFLVSKNQEQEYEGVKLRYGLIDKSGTMIVPMEGDSISFSKELIIVYNSKVFMINETRGKVYPQCKFYGYDGKLIKSMLGSINEVYPGGFYLTELTDTRDEDNRNFGRPIFSSSSYLCDNNLNRITEKPISITETLPGYIIYKEMENAPLSYNPPKKYIVISTEDFSQAGTFTDYIKVSDTLSLLESKNSTGIVYLASGDFTIQPYNKHDFDIYSGHVVLYNNLNEDAIAIDKQIGEITHGKVVRTISSSEIEFLPKGQSGKIIIDGFECEDVLPINDDGDVYSVLKGDKWGVYNSYQKELLFPFVFPAPINKRIGHECVIIRDNKGLSVYNKAGTALLTISDGKIADYEDNLIYIDNSWTPTGVYSTKLSKWILPYKKYDYIHRLEGGNFAAKDGEKYLIIGKNGQILNTLTNVKELSNMDGEYFIRVISNDGKLGLINRNNGRWIVKCIYENDIAWGSGESQNRRFAITQKRDTGEFVTIMTVSGKTIASKFFPYGTSRRAIHNFGNQYLYQTYR